MFARVFDTARRILSRSPSYQGRSSEARDSSIDSPDLSDNMVTTRGGIETPGSVATPSSSARKRVAKRELDALETPTQAKRQRKTAPRKTTLKETSQPEESLLESAEESSDTIVVTESDQTNVEKDGRLPLRQRSSPSVVIRKPSTMSRVEDVEAGETVDQPGYHTPEEQPGSVYATPVTRKSAAGSPTPKPRKTTATDPPSTAKKGRARAKKSQQEGTPNGLEVTQVTTKVFDDEIPSSTFETEATTISSQETSPQPRRAHKRFGSEEPTTIQNTITVHNTTTQPEPTDTAITIQDSDVDADSDDEAPEVLTTAAASSAIAAATAETQRARQALEQKVALKRAAREELLAAQAAAKKEREEKKARKAARALAKQQKLQAQQDAEPETAPFAFQTPSTSSLLPAAFLDSLPDTRPPTPPPASLNAGKSAEELHREKLNRHIKFLERGERGVKDVKKGKLSVSVLRRENAKLAPKARRDTGQVRERWLKGREGKKKKKGKSGMAGGKGERRMIGGRGFGRGDDD